MLVLRELVVGANQYKPYDSALEMLVKNQTAAPVIVHLSELDVF